MDSVGQLTGGIAHDFNNLLTGVIGSLGMMQRRTARGETKKIERDATTVMTSAHGDDRGHHRQGSKTGYAEHATVANGFLDPGRAMIIKSFAVEALARRVRDMIERD